MAKKIKIKEGQPKQRLDAFALEKHPTLSRSNIQTLIRNAKITVNNEQQKTGYMLKKGDVVTIEFDEAELSIIPSIDLPILYEDDDCLVIDKPIGILSHSKGVFNPEATVASFIASKVTDMSGDRAGIVHRLDRATSGVMICAKNKVALSWLQKQFAIRKVKKTYYAVIESGLVPAEAIIDMPIERDPKNRKQFRVGLNGKAAKTNYKIIADGSKYSLVELAPLTGRTHQLRVHLKHLKRPVVGDEVYGGKPADRLMLHAHSLEITLPSKARKTFLSTTPSEFKQYIAK